jgi:hypothetical protein
MKEEEKCPLYRKPEGLSFGKGAGYCDFDSGKTICEGDVKSCEKPDALKRYLHAKVEDMENKSHGE